MAGSSLPPPLSPKAALRECLASLNLPPGLLSSILTKHRSCDSRLWLIDNSSLMKVRDSHVGRGGANFDSSTNEGSIERVDNVSRWEESQDTVAFHARMAARCWIPTKYWLVNEPSGPNGVTGQSKRFGLCWSTPEDVPAEMAHVRNVMKNLVLDQTKCELTARIESLAKSIAKEESNLAARNNHITVVICTQGLPTNERGQTGKTIRREFQQALWKLSKLPVKVIVRLTTDDEKVRDMFNDMDSNFGSVDVLDDYWGEAMEVYLHNPWLTYSMGLHRLRESGLAPDVLDDLDERPLTLDEIHQFCQLLFLGENGANGSLPLPPYQPTSSKQLQRVSWVNNWIPFIVTMEELINKEKKQWNPVKRRQTPWIDIKKLESTLKDQTGSGDDDNEHQRFTGASPSFNGGGRASQRPPQRANRHTTNQSWQRGMSEDPDEDSQPRRAQSARPAPTPPPSRKDSNAGQQSQRNNNLTLEQSLQRWSHHPPDYKRSYPLANLLVTVPSLFPPQNSAVEAHDYFAKWKKLDKEAFVDESGDVLKELLKRAVRQAKFFLHPDRLPKDLTENQSELFKQIWHVIQEREQKTLG